MAPEEKKDPNELLRMKAPKGDDVATVTRAAWENPSLGYKEQGYTLIDANGVKVKEDAGEAPKAGDK